MRSLSRGAVIAAAAAALASCSSLAQQVVADTPASSLSFLAQQALKATLQDASPIFGLLGSPCNASGEGPGASWMKSRADSTPLARLNIPGTHESATWNFSAATRDALGPLDASPAVADIDVFRCQGGGGGGGMADMLAAGVRFFDLRYAGDPTGTALVFWHSQALLSERATLDGVLLAFYAWLAAHPSETVVLSMQYEGSTTNLIPGVPSGNDATVQRRLFDALTSPASKQYVFQGPQNTLPTLGEARGKAILFRRFDLDALPPSYSAALPGVHFPPALWTDDDPDMALVYDPATNATAYIEDFYEPDGLDPSSASAADVIAAKANATLAHLAKAADPDFAPDALFVTFASAEYVAASPPVYPRHVALGNGSALTPRGGVNQMLLDFLLPGNGNGSGSSGNGTVKRGGRLGIVVLDFYDEPAGLVEAIYNF